MKLIHRILALASGLALSVGVAAQAAFSSKPVRLVVNLAVGGLADLMARAFAEHLQGKIGQPVLVESLAGANGVIGARAVARAPADGHALLFTVENVVTISPIVQQRLAFNPRTELHPFSLVGMLEQVLLVNPQKVTCPRPAIPA